MKRRLRLAVLLATYFEDDTGGSELQVKYLLEAARKTKDWDIHYIFLSTKKEFKNPLSIQLHPIQKRRVWLKLRNIKYPYFLPVWKNLKAIRPDVIYQRCSSSFTGIATLYALYHKSKVIFHIASEGDLKLHKKKKDFITLPELKLAEFGIKRCDVIIAQTNHQKKLLKEKFHRSAVLIRNGHPSAFNINKDKEEILVLWVANWKPVKQPEVFIKLAETIGNLPNVRWIMIGRTGNYNSLAARARKAGITVLGEITHEEVNQWLSRGHILVNTSYQEGFSNTFIQAWMHRVPVVSLYVDPDCLIINEELGFYSGNFANLVRNTSTLILDSKLREDIGERAQSFAMRNFPLSNLEKILGLIDGLVSQSTHSHCGCSDNLA